MNKADLHKIIQEEVQDYLIQESIVNWMLDKAGDFAKSAIKHKADYQYAGLMKDPSFRSLHKQFGMSEKEFVNKAENLIKRDPKKFADLLAYDVKKSRYGKFFQ